MPGRFPLIHVFDLGAVLLVLGPADVAGSRVLALRFLQARDPSWVGRPFFAKYDENAFWLDDLEPAFEKRFFFEEELEAIYARNQGQQAEAVCIVPPALPSNSDSGQNSRLDRFDRISLHVTGSGHQAERRADRNRLQQPHQANDYSFRQLT